MAGKKQKVESDEIEISTISPIVAYSTFSRENGSKYTCYFSPNENDFSRIVKENIVKVQTNDSQCTQRNNNGDCLNWITTPVEKWFKKNDIYPRD